MSHDGRLPDNVSDADIDALYPEHDPRCPQHEGAEERCKCGDLMKEHLAALWCEWGPGELDADPECKCSDLADDDDADKSDAAEARADSMRMGD